METDVEHANKGGGGTRTVLLPDADIPLPFFLSFTYQLAGSKMSLVLPWKHPPLSLSLALFFSVRRHPSLFKGKFRSGWFSQAVLDKAQGGACSIRETVAESGTRLVACLYSLQLYKKDVKTEGNRGRDYNLTRDRQDLSLSLFLARRLTIKLHRSPCSLSCRQRVPSCETSTDLSVSRRGFWEGKKRKRKEEGGNQGSRF